VRPILTQVQKGKYCTIYPFELAACQVLYPTPTWAEKAKLRGDLTVGRVRASARNPPFRGNIGGLRLTPNPPYLP
jgi:hypothetical protein